MTPPGAPPTLAGERIERFGRVVWAHMRLILNDLLSQPRTYAPDSPLYFAAGLLVAIDVAEGRILDGGAVRLELPAERRAQVAALLDFDPTFRGEAAA